MRVATEAIAAALFARLQSVPGLTTVARELHHWDDVPPVTQPAAFQATETADAPPPGAVAGGRASAGSTQWTLRYSWYVYNHRASPALQASGALLDTSMNDLVDACRTALAPPSGATKQTLGGLVADCRVAGAVERDGGVLGDQGVAIVPIEVRCFPTTA